MPRPGTFGRQLRSLLWKASVADEVDAELAFHVEMRTREYITRGLDPELARAKAIGRFGDLKRVNDTCRRIGEGRERDMRRAEWIHEFVQDARYALRQLAREGRIGGIPGHAGRVRRAKAAPGEHGEDSKAVRHAPPRYLTS